jgi:hypothetical protein
MSVKASAADELRDPPRMNFVAKAISADARELIKEIHLRVLEQYASSSTRSYNRKAARGQLPLLLGAMVGELLHARTADQTLGWMSLCVRNPHLSTFGYSWLSFSKLLDVLQREGLIERLRGYYSALGLTMPRPSRNARIRASAKLAALCAEHLITSDNIQTHFRFPKTKKPRTMPGPKLRGES